MRWNKITDISKEEEISLQRVKKGFVHDVF